MTQSISDDTPNGHCRTCGYPLLNGAGHTKVCVNCSTHSEPSGLVNETVDPGHAAVVKELGTMIRPKEREAVALDSDPNVKPVKANNVQTNTGEKKEDMMQPDQAIQILRDYFASLPVTDLQQAKSLLKLRKEIDKLDSKIQTFIGGQVNV